MTRKKILIIGYGAAGKSLHKDLKRHAKQVVGFLDDTHKDKLVLGKLSDVNSVIRTHSITDIYFAIPSVSAKVLRDFINRVEDPDVKISIIPRSFSILSKETVNINDLTDEDILTLVGRQPVKHDVIASKKFIRGKSIVVTGAAGSIGSKLEELLAKLAPKKIMCIDWWENGTFALQHDMCIKSSLVYKIADINNPYVIKEIFKTYKPDVIFHAAAYKHVPLMQDNAIEAFNNNVWGSLNLMRLAVDSQVKNFVYVSTD